MLENTREIAGRRTSSVCGRHCWYFPPSLIVSTSKSIGVPYIDFYGRRPRRDTLKEYILRSLEAPIMSGVEVAGLVLACLPLIIQGALGLWCR
jgi:hypothetical protein